MWRWRMDTGHKDEWKQGVKFYLATCFLLSIVLRLCPLIIWSRFSWLQRAFRSTEHVVVGVLELLWASRGGLWYCTLIAILMTYHCQDLGSAFDWSFYMANLLQPIRGTIKIWVVTHHQQRNFYAFLRHHFAGKPAVMTSWNVGCFLRLRNECLRFS